MAGSSFGTIFRITTWGESHGKALGVVVDGCPAGLPLSEDDIQPFLDRRKPGQSLVTTQRKENDRVEILSGVFEGVTTGTPISMILYNTSQISGDYAEIATYYRPGHADYTFDAKYGFRDYRGGGRSSGRETAGRVAAGAIAIKILKTMGIEVTAYTRSIGPVEINDVSFDKEAIYTTVTAMPDREASRKAEEFLADCRARTDSAGGVVEVLVDSVPAGIGEPVFNKLDACLSKALFSIGAVKAVEIGSGTAAAKVTGSQNNDPFIMTDKGIAKKSNHAGGILGGISDGSRIVARAYFKPTPSIARTQDTVSKDGREIQVRIKGRHDPVVVPRAVVVVEAMTALTLVDLLFTNMPARMDRLTEFYSGKQ